MKQQMCRAYRMNCEYVAIVETLPQLKSLAKLFKMAGESGIDLHGQVMDAERKTTLTFYGETFITDIEKL